MLLSEDVKKELEVVVKAAKKYQELGLVALRNFAASSDQAKEIKKLLGVMITAKNAIERTVNFE